MIVTVQRRPQAVDPVERPFLRIPQRALAELATMITEFVYFHVSPENLYQAGNRPSPVDDDIDACTHQPLQHPHPLRVVNQPAMSDVPIK